LNAREEGWPGKFFEVDRILTLAQGDCVGSGGEQQDQTETAYCCREPPWQKDSLASSMGSQVAPEATGSPGDSPIGSVRAAAAHNIPPPSAQRNLSKCDFSLLLLTTSRSIYYLI
jgi:hypothetical protein